MRHLFKIFFAVFAGAMTLFMMTGIPVGAQTTYECSLSDNMTKYVGESDSIYLYYEKPNEVSDYLMVPAEFISISNSEVAYVDESGEIHFTAAGTTKITVKYDGQTFSGSYVVAEVKIIQPEKKLTMYVGGMYRLGLSSIGSWETWIAVSFKSTKKSVATVDSNGIVTAVGPGKTTIKVKGTNGKTYKCKVTVKDATDLYEKKTVSVGDRVYFGEYEQDAVLDNGKEPIMWRVLKTEGNKALLISEYALDCPTYFNEEGMGLNEDRWKVDNSYESTWIRKWLNEDFYNTAFSSKDQDLIVLTQNNNQGETWSVYYKYRDNDTFDNVFLLSTEEVASLFKGKKEYSKEPSTPKYWNFYSTDMCTNATPYAVAKGLLQYLRDENSNNGFMMSELTPGLGTHGGMIACDWMTRTVTAEDTEFADRVSHQGMCGLDFFDDYWWGKCGARPCVWVSLDALNGGKSCKEEVPATRYLSAYTVNMYPEEQVQLSLVNSDGEKVTWTSSNTSVLTVKDGKVTPVKNVIDKETTVIITAKVNGCQYRCKVIVKVPGWDHDIDELHITKDKNVAKSEVVGTTVLSYSSSNTKVATIDKYGRLTGKKKGSVTISAKCSNGKTYSYKLVVADESLSDYENQVTIFYTDGTSEIFNLNKENITVSRTKTVSHVIMGTYPEERSAGYTTDLQSSDYNRAAALLEDGRNRILIDGYLLYRTYSDINGIPEAEYRRRWLNSVYYECTPLEWNVIRTEKSGDKLDIYLIASRPIGVRTYIEDYQTDDFIPDDYGANWEESILRSWLNSYGKSENYKNRDYTGLSSFFNLAFSDSVKKVLKKMPITMEMNYPYPFVEWDDSVKHSTSTTFYDYVTAPSIDDLMDLCPQYTSLESMFYDTFWGTEYSSILRTPATYDLSEYYLMTYYGMDLALAVLGYDVQPVICLSVPVK